MAKIASGVRECVVFSALEETIEHNSGRWSSAAVACARTFSGQIASEDEWCRFIDRIDAALTVVRDEDPASYSVITRR